MDCYGEYMDAARCKACGLREYCKESSALDRQQVVFSYDDEALPAPGQAPGNEPAKLLGELLYALHDQPEAMSAVVQLLHHVCEIYHSNPLGFSITLTKLLNNEMTYTQIGERYDVSKQLVAYYLKQSVKFVPLLQCALLVDRRRCSHSLTPGHNHVNSNSLAGIINARFGSLWSFSVESGISYSVIWKAINRHTKPSGKTRKRIAEALDITPLELQLRFRI